MKQAKKLTALSIRAIKEPGYHSAGSNLFLQVSKTGTKSWIFRFGQDGKKREMGLGSFEVVSLLAAQTKALQCRLMLLEGRDPIAERNASRAALSSAASRHITFRECAENLIASKRAGWKNEKHAQQWENTLATYAYPFVGSMQVSDVDTAAVRKCIDPIWTTKTETASRLRQRIEAVLDWAKAHGHRSGDNPAAWRGHLQAALAAPTDIRKKKHHAAIPVGAAVAFAASLRERQSMSALALEFLMLTAARTGEVTGATWAEVDLSKRIWTVSAERMKAKVEHTIPLSRRAAQILTQRKSKADGEPWIFPGAREGKPLSNMAMLELLRGMGTLDEDGAPATVHGFRSTFRQWCAEHTEYPREVAEHALAHRLPDKVEAAYQRSTLVEKRKGLMEDWAQFLSAPA